MKYLRLLFIPVLFTLGCSSDPYTEEANQITRECSMRLHMRQSKAKTKEEIDQAYADWKEEHNDLMRDCKRRHGR